MKGLRTLLGVILCSLFIGIFSGSVLADEQRDYIYIGDLITIEVKTEALTKEQVVDSLKPFEVVEIDETDKGFIVTMRIFEPGEHKLTVGDQELLVVVRSTLEDYDRDDIIEADLSPRDISYEDFSFNNVVKYMEWWIVYYGLIGIFALSGLALLLKLLFRKRKAKSKPPFARFIADLKRIDLSTEACLVELTSAFKKYIEGIYNCKIIGKTSSEIMEELKPFEELNPFRELIENWLTTCDRYKFSGYKAELNEKEVLKSDLKKIVSSIHDAKEVKV